MYQPKLEKDIRCPLEYGLEIFGGKWKSRIICVLAEMKTLRYSELRKEMSNITDAVLASTLKELIRDKIVERKSFDEIPPHVEYSLSEKGLSVVPILKIFANGRVFFIMKTMTILLHNVKNAIIGRKYLLHCLRFSRRYN